MSELVQLLVGNQPWGMIIVSVAFGCAVAVVSIVTGAFAGAAKTRAQEQTKRELAAYVAEGSMKPEDAVAIVNAGRPKWEVHPPARGTARA